MDNWKTRGLALGLLWLRVLAGLGIATHGYGKLFTGRISGFAESVAAMGFPFPAFFAWAAALSEFAGGMMMAAGFFTRIGGGAVFLTMTVAIFVRHGADTFAVKELALAYWAMAGAVFLCGPGPFSLDKVRGGE
jgi:putative oxidoreductase